MAKQANVKRNAAPEPENTTTVLKSNALTNFFDDVIDRWDEIRSSKGYVGTLLKNMLKTHTFNQNPKAVSGQRQGQQPTDTL